MPMADLRRDMGFKPESYKLEASIGGGIFARVCPAHRDHRRI
jgi:hypothetical protein